MVDSEPPALHLRRSSADRADASLAQEHGGVVVLAETVEPLEILSPLVLSCRDARLASRRRGALHECVVVRRRGLRLPTAEAELQSGPAPFRAGARVAVRVSRAVGVSSRRSKSARPLPCFTSHRVVLAPVGLVKVPLQFGGRDLCVSTRRCRARMARKLLRGKEASVARHDRQPSVTEPVRREAIR